MKLLLLAFGSRGDVQPLLPLAVGLRQAGYEVQLAAGTNFKSWVENRGIEIVDVGVDGEALMNSATGEFMPVSSRLPPFHPCALAWFTRKSASEPLDKRNRQE